MCPLIDQIPCKERVRTGQFVHAIKSNCSIINIWLLLYHLLVFIVWVTCAKVQSVPESSVNLNRLHTLYSVMGIEMLSDRPRGTIPASLSATPTSSGLPSGRPPCRGAWPSPPRLTSCWVWVGLWRGRFFLWALTLSCAPPYAGSVRVHLHCCSGHP